MKGVTYEDMRPGSYEVKPRLEDMDVNHIEAALCFPTFPRFCGQTFTEAKDKELACSALRHTTTGWSRSGAATRAAASSPSASFRCGRRAGGERKCGATRREVCGPCASARSRPSSACERARSRPLLGPLLRACAETQTIVNMHIGSSSKMPSTSADAPPAVGSTLTHTNATLLARRLPLQRRLRAHPRPQGGLLGRPDRVDSVHSGAGRPSLGGQRGWAGSPTSCRRSLELLQGPRVGLLLRRRPRVKSWTKSARTTSRTSRTTRTRTRPARTRGDRRGAMRTSTDEHAPQIVRGNAIKLFGLDLPA